MAILILFILLMANISVSFIFNASYVTFIITIIFILSFIGFVIGKKISILNPFVVFIISWFSISAITFFPWRNYVYYLGDYIYSYKYLAYFWTSTSFMILGLAVPFILKKRKKKKYIKPFSKEKNCFYYKNLKKINSYIYLLSITSYLIYFISIKGFPVFSSSQISDMRNSFYIPGLDYLKLLSRSAISISFLNYFELSNRKFKALQPFFLICTVLLIILNGKKWPIMIMVVIFTYYLILYNKNRIKLIFTSFISMIGIVFLNIITRDTFNKFNEYFIESDLVKVNNRVFGVILTYLIQYVVQNFYTINQTINSGKVNYAYGLNTFQFILSPIMTSEMEAELLKGSEFFVNKAVAYFGYYYLDFDILGLIVTPFIVGIFISLIYLEFKKKKLKFIIIYGFIVQSILFLFAQNTFSNVSLFLNSMLIIIIFKFLKNVYKRRYN